MGLMKSIGNILGGTSSAEQNQSTTVAARDADQQKIWSDYINSLNALSGNLTGQSQYLDQAFGDYIGEIGTANTTYQDTINSLMSGLGNESNRIGFSLAGNEPVSFVSRPDRLAAETMAGLAGNVLSSASTVPTLTYEEAQTNNPYTAALQYYDIINAAKEAEENRRYQLKNTTTTSADTSTAGVLDILSSLGNTYSALKGTPNAVTGADTGLLSLFARS